MSEEKKISLDELEDLLEDAQDSPKTNSWFSLPNLFALLVLNWQWFLLSLIICLSVQYPDSGAPRPLRMLYILKIVIIVYHIFKIPVNNTCFESRCRS